MISKAQKKHIKSLKLKKNRNLHKEFIVEGNKSIHDFIKNGYKPIIVHTTTPSYWNEYLPIQEISKKELGEISFLKNPKDSLAIFKIKESTEPEIDKPIIILDNLQDPGNMGTIIRTADWFGINDIICSEDTVDCYSPKVVQASMGSLSKMNISYRNLGDFLKQYPKPIYGTFMNGKNALTEKYPEQFALIIGNEGNGISKEVEKLVTHKITIPKHPDASAESLNAAIAHAIIISKIFS
jgi:TrmH family RNA methyltransferase